MSLEIIVMRQFILPSAFFACLAIIGCAASTTPEPEEGTARSEEAINLGPNRCAAMHCIDGACDPETGRCVPSPLPPIPVRCGTEICAKGTYCVNEAVECIQAPCAPIPHCVPYPTCKTERCDPGQHCVDEPILCVRAPCPPTAPRCVDDPPPVDPCAAVRCQAGTECKVVDGRPACQPQYPTCATNPDCGPFQHCVDIPAPCVGLPCTPTHRVCVRDKCPDVPYIDCAPIVTPR